jgi:hypothetical protein
LKLLKEALLHKRGVPLANREELVTPMFVELLKQQAVGHKVMEIAGCLSIREVSVQV